MTSREQAVLAAIDMANAADSERDATMSGPQPAALLYGQRMSDVLTRMTPDASEALRIAARGQHLERWKIPRKTYPEGRAGYLRWRNDLKQYHARRVGEIMAAAGYEPPMIARVGELIRKERLKQDAEAQTLEDVACVVFLEFYFKAFEGKSSPDKLADILAKTWRKMSPDGHAHALKLALPPHLPQLLEQGLARLAGR